MYTQILHRHRFRRSILVSLSWMMMMMYSFLMVRICTGSNRIQDKLGSFEGSIVRVKGDPILARRAERVTEEELRGGNLSIAEGIVRKMIQGVRETHGSCIAAPQIGVSKRIVLMSLAEERLREEDPNSPNVVSPPSVLINPEIFPMNESVDMKTIPVWEGCLSVPGTYVVVNRYETIRYRAQRLDGAYVEGIATGRLALTLQHEVDHLFGILMTDVSTNESNPIRSDARGAVTSTTHWDMMNDDTYDIRTYIFPGATVTPSPGVSRRPIGDHIDL